jgi:methyl-accepting chemotaxis protein
VRSLLLGFSLLRIRHECLCRRSESIESSMSYQRPSDTASTTGGLFSNRLTVLLLLVGGFLLAVPLTETLALELTGSKLLALGVAGGLAVVGIVVVRQYVVRNLTQPLEDLADATERVAGGDYETPVTVSGSDDVARSGQALDQLRTRVVEEMAAVERESQRAEAALEDAAAEAKRAETEATRANDLAETAEAAAAEAEVEAERAEEAREAEEEAAAALEAAVDGFGQKMRRAAAGDLTQRLAEDTGLGVVDRVAVEFNAMMDELEGTMRSLREFGVEVATLSEQVADGAAEIGEASEEVTASIVQISEGAAEQNEHQANVAREMNTMSAAVQQIASAADELAGLSRAAAEEGEAGRVAARSALDGIGKIERETDQTVAAVEELDAQMAEIGEIVAVITDIAEQTNILALNANIEAARAGEAGEGFAVVSNEVKSLAERTKASAGEIALLIDEIAAQRDEVVAGMESMQARVAEGSESVDTALDALDEIIGRVEETDAGVEEITAATSEQATSAQEVLSMVDEIASIGEETTAEAQNVSAAAQQQTASISEVGDGVRRLSAGANDLRSLLEQFTVDGVESEDSVPFDWVDDDSTEDRHARPEYDGDRLRPVAADGG